MRISSTYPVWELQPRGLTIEEVNNPYQVLEDFFDYANLPERREMLWQWFESTVTDAFATQLDRRERAWIASSYTDIQKLMEAAYLLHQTHQAQIAKDSDHDTAS